MISNSELRERGWGGWGGWVGNQSSLTTGRLKNKVSIVYVV